MNLFRYMLLATGALLPVLQGEEWRSPHPLEWEIGRPALIPFPKQVDWGAPAERSSDPCEEQQPVSPQESRWLLVGDRCDSDMVRTAWSGLLRELSRQGAPRRLTCHLRLDDHALLEQMGELFIQAPEHGREAYCLSIEAGEAQVTAAFEEGLFYGLQTLRQLIAGGLGNGSVRIKDYPAFAVRGFHHDCGRNFQTIESLKRQIDLASQLKINYFHWHLSDYPVYHLECRKYPQLNSPEYRTRDQESTYTYEQVRELIAYAKAHHITVIPEIDMPGHSDYFVRAFGVEMHTEQGMKILEDVLDEFCAEIPAEDCPIIHIGADEVSVPNAKEFIARMSRKLAEHGRRPMQWEGPWDLPVGECSIAQRWVQGRASQAAESIKQLTVDSSIGYSNLLDPALLVRRWFFMQPCGVAKGDELRGGAIFCTWPDRRVEDKSLIPVQSPQWPGMCAMAERAWVGGSSKAADAFPTDMPAPDTEAARAFSCFESRMWGIRGTLFRDEAFPYWPEDGRENLIIGPVPEEQIEAVRAQVLAGQFEGLPVRKAYGGSLYFHTSPGAWNLGMFSQVKPGHCVWVVTQVQAEQAGEAPFMLGFDAPLRSHQYYTGIPAAGEWSRCATRLWMNGVELKNPRHYVTAPRQWETMVKDGEIPLCNEEIWWTQPPTMLPLQKGSNTVVIEQPYTTRIQSWSASFVPLPLSGK